MCCGLHPHNREKLGSLWAMQVTEMLPEIPAPAGWGLPKDSSFPGRSPSFPLVDQGCRWGPEGDAGHVLTLPQSPAEGYRDPCFSCHFPVYPARSSHVPLHPGPESWFTLNPGAWGILPLSIRRVVLSAGSLCWLSQADFRLLTVTAWHRTLDALLCWQRFTFQRGRSGSLESPSLLQNY